MCVCRVGWIVPRVRGGPPRHPSRVISAELALASAPGGGRPRVRVCFTDDAAESKEGEGNLARMSGSDRERRSLLRGGGALPSADGTLTHLHGSLIPWVFGARGCGQGRASASRLLLHTQPTARSARGPRQHLQLVSSEGRETCPPARSPQRAPRFSHGGKAAGLDAPGSARRVGRFPLLFPLITRRVACHPYARASPPHEGERGAPRGACGHHRTHRWEVLHMAPHTPLRQIPATFNRAREAYRPRPALQRSPTPSSSHGPTACQRPGARADAAHGRR